MTEDKLGYFFNQIEKGFAQGNLVKLSLGHYTGNEPDLKNIIIKPILLKKGLMLSFTYRYKTKDIAKNFSFEEAVTLLHQLLHQTAFKSGNLNLVAKKLSVQYIPKGKWILTEEQHQAVDAPSLLHDNQKQRKITTQNKAYLNYLGITNKNGEVYKHAQDKYRQINHYIEILSSLLMELPKQKKLQIADMGAGKGYLTFALFDYLQHELKRNVQVVGVEYRQDLVDLCNQIAIQSAFSELSFVQGTIDNYSPADSIDVLIALHACDTATDDAIFKGIKDQAALIVVAPCCHKQIRRQMEQGQQSQDFSFLLKHGIFMERQAEMVTDAIRALILEYYGYAAKVFQFISDAHTPKNIMIVAQKRKIALNNQPSILAQIRKAKSDFGITQHYLEKVCGI